MYDPFAAALAALHSSPMSLAAIYAPPQGASISLRVIRDQGDATAGDGFGRASVETNFFVIRKVDVDRPVTGATLLIGSDLFRLQGAPAIDAEGLSWRCPAVPA